MLSYEIPSPAMYFDALSAFHYLQQRQFHDQLMHQKPKIIKKIDAERFYQIQIFKQNGDFRSYEMKVLRNNANPNVINLVVESERDEFRKIFAFQRGDIKIEEIDWQYFKNDNLLVLNIPKKPKFCPEDFMSTLANVLNKAKSENSLNCRGIGRSEMEEEDIFKHAFLQKIADRGSAQRKEVVKQMQHRKELERLAVIETEKQQVKLRENARRKALAEKKASIEAEKQKRLAAVKSRKREEEIIRKANEEKEGREKLDEAQKFLSALLGGALVTHFGNDSTDEMSSVKSGMGSSGVQPYNMQAHDHATVSQILTPETYQSGHHQIEDEETESDVGSIHSESSDHPESAEAIPESKDNSLRRHPSMEEVEDEEFVVLRKKFGQ